MTERENGKKQKWERDSRTTTKRKPKEQTENERSEENKKKGKKEGLEHLS